MTLQEMLDSRNKLVAEARALNDKANAEGREFTPEEEAQYSAIMKDAGDLRAKVDRERAIADAEAEINKTMGTRAAQHEQPGGERGEQDQKELRAICTRWIQGGASVLSADEARSLSAGADIQGGYITTPQEMVKELLKKVDDLVFIRQKATKFALPKASSLGVPVLDNNPADADWTSELLTGNEDTTMSFGKRELRPHPLAKRIKISNLLIRTAVMDPEALVRDRLAYKFAITEEKAYMTGSGAQQPLGLFTASAKGIDTDRDVSLGHTATGLTFDGLIEAKYTLKPQYWSKAEWLFHRDALKMITKLKNGEGEYIWQESLIIGGPDTLLGLPFTMSEYVPNTFTASLYVGMLGDFSFYWIVDALNMTMQRLVELYAETNQIGFIARRELDGMPVLSEAFIRIALAAS